VRENHIARKGKQIDPNGNAPATTQGGIKVKKPKRTRIEPGVGYSTTKKKGKKEEDSMLVKEVYLLCERRRTSEVRR